MDRRGFFRPHDAWVGDVIPWQEDGRFHLFYLYESRRIPRPGMPWHRVVTDDLVTFTETGPALSSGGTDAADFNVYTGSVVVADGIHHVFYTGQNPNRRGADGLPVQVVLHATSGDGMQTWDRHPEHTFGATPGYETADWRDPFVFRDEVAGLWRMLITARHTDGPERRRGVIAQCVSHDLRTWEPVEPFWDPRRYIAHECPEVFEWNGWWYLVWSEFSESFTTRYRVSRSLHGPWSVPENDTLDGRAYYAAKSAARDGRRFFFGWISSREGGTDEGAWQWAGTLSVLEAEQNPDGSLRFHPPRELADTFDTNVVGLASGTVLTAADGYRDLVIPGEIPARFRVDAVVDIAPGTTECGVLLRASPDGDEGYVLRLEPRRNRVVFDRWPRPRTGGEQWQISGDVPFAVELERPLPLPPGPHRIEVVVDGDLCVATVDGAVTLSTRLYDRTHGAVGVFVGEGSATVLSLEVTTGSPGERTNTLRDDDVLVSS
ncbi:family 43 glycosylhydrolase [Microbacterium trichothecenolyticum]|uniref:beta-fructofuranosidase n=1 Tax=Microbacterium trichothecenolyticum TaxID=69370 RepID=A0ABU0TUC9_MICTR|nr:family 43 glycosylhydrolase [Microbacterium trichothecenolyticum]MDQ1123271.1 beta-fructofuranosidase [Microbacterium trichothecenolyticum]